MSHHRLVVALLLLSIAPGRCSGSGDSDDEDGEWVRVTETELEGPGDGDRLSRRIQLDVALSSRDVRLTLERNDNVPSNVTVVIGEHGRLTTSTTDDVSSRRSAYYFDSANEASILMQVTSANGNRVNRFSGSFQVGRDRYVLKPPSQTSSSRRRRRDADTRSDPAVSHVVFREQPSRIDSYEPSALRLPTEAQVLRTMGRRERSNTLPTVLTNIVQMVIAVDYQLYIRFYNVSRAATPTNKQSDALNMIYSYFSHVVNGVDMRYRSIANSTYTISVQLVGYYIATTQNDSRFIEDNRRGQGVSSYIEAEPALMRFIDFMAANKDLFPSFDEATLVISEPMNGQTGNRIAGLAFYQAICTQYSAAIVREAGEYATTQIVTHELGHTLGCVHDQLDNRCSAADMHIMVASPGPLSDRTYKNAYTFSRCSIAEMQTFLAILTQADLNCLMSSSVGHFQLPALLPGQMFNPDVQCQIMLGLGAFYCAGKSNDNQLCRSMKCYHPDFQYCYTTYEQRAFSGTTCGNRKWCQYGDCVSNSTAPRAPDVCVHGDSKIELSGGLQCSNISSRSAWNCYDRSTADFCCETCSRLRNTSRTGCEFGNKSPVCRGVRLSNCSDSYINQTCCLLCADYRPPTVKTTLPTTTPSTTSTTSTPSECPGGDRRSNCDHLIVSGVQCYTYAKDCCATCAKFKTNVSGCEYGDRDETCSSIKNRVTCYSRSSTCCATCRALRNTNIRGCEWGDKTPGWCTSILTEQCYDIESTCCKTCHDRRSVEPGCKYGDRSRRWCTSTIRYLHQCYSYRSYCCGTCNYYRTGPRGCEWGDRKLRCNRRNCNNPSSWITCCRTCSGYIPSSITTTTPTTTTTVTTTTTPTTTTTTTATTTTPTASTSTTPTPSPTTTSTPRAATTTISTSSTSTTTSAVPTTTTTEPTTTTTTLRPKTTTTSRATTTTKRARTSSTTTSNPTTTVVLSISRQRNSTTRRSESDSATTTTTAAAAVTTTAASKSVKECSGDIAWWCPYIEATDCYDAAATCCRTCEKYRKPVPGCEYGDRYWWCSSGNYCYNDFLRSTCCITCRTTPDLPACRDDSTACTTINAADCYNRITRTNCCQTCAKFDTGTPGCEYGDRETWCYDVARSECSFYQEQCCQTCS